MRKFALVCTMYTLSVVGLLVGCGLAKQDTLDGVRDQVDELERTNYELRCQVDMLTQRVHQLEQELIPPEPEKPMSVADRIRKVAKEEGYPYPEKLIKLAKCESSLNPKAKNVSRRERSYGVFQINLKAHRHITYEQATDVEWATRWSIGRIRKSGFRDWKICSRRMGLR